MGLMDDAKRAAKRSADLAEMSDAKRIDRLRAEYDEMGVLLADKHNVISALRADAVRRIEENDRVLVANGRLRAELAEAKEALRLSAQGLHTYVEALNAGNAALAAKAKRFDYAVEAIDLKDKELIQERTLARDLRKRVGELEGLFSHVGVETHKWFDPECGHEGCQSLVLKARAKQVEAQLSEWKEQFRVLAILEQQKTARIAELENKNSYNLQIVREATAHIAELEELEADALQCASVEPDLRRECRARAERAKAERDALHLFSGAQAAVIKEMREALVIARQWMPVHPIEDAARRECAIVDAALAPSPAGREERHEMTSIGDKEPDADSAGREG